MIFPQSKDVQDKLTSISKWHEGVGIKFFLFRLCEALW